MQVKIIFVCTGNTCRSPMAQFLLESLLAKNHNTDIKVLSAGIAAYSPHPISEHARTLLSERNIDASYHRATLFTPKLVDQNSLILTMSSSHTQAIVENYPFLSSRTYTLCEYVSLGSSISDPFGGSLETYRLCMSEIEKLVNNLYLQI